MSKTHILHWIDAFASRPFTGNPAGVCVVQPEAWDAIDPAWMQRLAGELGIAETAFTSPRGDAFPLRWFTPQVEVDLCGHATLASAHVLFELGLAGDAIRFSTRSGTLSATKGRGTIALDFPAQVAVPDDPPADLVAALGARPVASGRNRMDWLLELESDAAVRDLAPDLNRLGTMKSVARGVIVTARSARPTHDIVSRFFAPAVGVPEDPVTGSAHCALAPWWAERLGKNELRAFQASPRGGELELRLRGDRVDLIGRSVTVLRSTVSA